MKKLFILFSFMILALFLQGSGYVGEKPDIDSFFTQERVDIQKKINNSPIKNVNQEIDAPPSVGDIKPTLKLAPSAINKDNFQVINQAKKVGYVGDMLEFKPRLKKLKYTISNSSKLQRYAANVNTFKFYADVFLEKYKKKPDAKSDTYKSIKDINEDSQRILALWIDARDNSKYVPYSAFNGSYQPSVIRGELKGLGVKLDKALGLMSEVNL